MNYASYEDMKNIVTGMAKKIPHGVMLGNAPVGHIEWQMYLQRDYLKLDGTPLANASNDYDELLKFAQDNSLITADTTDKSLFKYDSTNDVLTLPDYIGLCLQGGNTVEEKEAGLPDVTGYFALCGANNTPIAYGAGGAFSIAPRADGAINQNTGSVVGNNVLISYRLQNGNSIYGNSTTVQPPAITLIPQIKYIKGTTVWEELDFNKLMPLGTVINFMGTTAPEYYLVCDGTIYNILEYSALANFFEEQFGSYNYFGGDGTTTFAVPDLRGEFLRGTGTNSHANQGSGASVGVHQDGTVFYNYRTEGSGGFRIQPGPSNAVSYEDSSVVTVGSRTLSGNVSSTVNEGSFVSSRPTNTSVLYCIKYK